MMFSNEISNKRKNENKRDVFFYYSHDKDEWIFFSATQLISR